MARIVEETRRIAAMIGDEERGTDTTLSAETNCQQMRRGLATVRPIEAGDRIEESDLTALRPGRGVSPLEIDTVTGTRATQNLPRLTIIDREDYELG
jgi:N-acetylneuraminate synthase/N,N'-diacetyllegionaminate synthase